MEVASVEPAGDLPAPGVQRGGLVLRRPVPRQGPLVESQPSRGGIHVRPARDHSAGRREILGASVAGVVLRDLRLAQSAAASISWAWGEADSRLSPPDFGLGQQLLDDHFRLPVFAFAEVVMPDTP